MQQRIDLPQFGSFVSSSVGGRGSGTITSKPAEKIVPFFNASTRSFCATTPDTED